MYDLGEPDFGVVKAALIQRGITQCADWTAPPVQAVATPQPLTLPGKQIEPAAAPRLTIAAAHDKSAGAQPSYQAPVYNKKSRRNEEFDPRRRPRRCWTLARSRRTTSATTS